MKKIAFLTLMLSLVCAAYVHSSDHSILGASYYWVMDLSGSLWEKVITIGNPLGRAFKGTNGDGKLSFGHATNEDEDWPKSEGEIGGFGYRAGRSVD